MPSVTRARACGVTENDLPNCHRAVNIKTADGTATQSPIQRALFHSPGRNAITRMTTKTAQNWRTKRGVIFELSGSVSVMGPILRSNAIQRDPGGCYE